MGHSREMEFRCLVNAFSIEPQENRRGGRAIKTTVVEAQPYVQGHEIVTDLYRSNHNGPFQAIAKSINMDVTGSVVKEKAFKSRRG